MASVVLIGSCVLAHQAYKSYKKHENRKMDILAAHANDAYSSDGSFDLAGEHPPGYEEALRTKHGRKRHSLRAIWPLSKRRRDAAVVLG